MTETRFGTPLTLCCTLQTEWSGHTNVIFDLTGRLYNVSRLFISSKEYHLPGSVARRVADEATVKAARSFSSEHLNCHSTGVPALHTHLHFSFNTRY